MRALLQRVSEAAVSVAGAETGRITTGWLALVGVTHTDTAREARRLADKTWNLRAFPDAGGRMDLPVADVGGEILVVSQFTLYADTRRGRRPGWSEAAPPEQAEPLVDCYVRALRDLGARVATGVFGAEMRVSLVNEGPVTLLLEVDAPPGR